MTGINPSMMMHPSPRRKTHNLCITFFKINRRVMIQQSTGIYLLIGLLVLIQFRVKNIISTKKPERLHGKRPKIYHHMWCVGHELHLNLFLLFSISFRFVSGTSLLHTRLTNCCKNTTIVQPIWQLIGSLLQIPIQGKHTM